MEQNVEYVIGLVDRVFAQLDQRPLLSNPDFSMDSELKHERFLRFRSKQNEGRIKVTFEITPYGLSFWLDRTNEIPEWSIEQIKERADFIEEELRYLFGSRIEVTYKGSKIVIRLLDSNGAEQRRYTYYEGLRFNLFSRTYIKQYAPFFATNAL